MKLLSAFLLVAILTLSDCVAQNVGVGTLTPTEKLDVNGNLNVQGNIKLNGIAGQSGQALITNGAGLTVWGNLSEYKNSRTFINSASFTIPEGVTTLLVEMWGAGGGGSTGGGGGSGAYSTGFMQVGSATSATITVGVGGSAASSAGGSANTGIGTAVVLNGVTITASGGRGATGTYSGEGGRIESTANYIGYAGSPGSVTSEVYAQRTSTQFVTSTYYGNGGSSPFTYATGGMGAFSSFNTSVPTSLIKTYEASDAAIPGGGGGGGIFSINFGSSGAKGLVIIRWQ